MARIANVNFGTKAETLERLRPRLKSSTVLPQICFTVGEWARQRAAVLEQLKKTEWSRHTVIVRSSSIAEDGNNHSLAGHYVSVPNVVGEAEVCAAVQRVCASYDRGNEKDQVFIQPMLQNVMISGVAFSRDPNTGGPYIIINYDDSSGSAQSVTSGKTNETKTFCYYKRSGAETPQALKKVIVLVSELERLLGSETLDIEFCITRDGELYLLQVRPLACSQPEQVSTNEHQEALQQIHALLKARLNAHPYLHGERTVFGVMPDWNPAEIIGVRPRPLALSLYRELVTDNIWAYQRDNYGYKNLRSFPLLLSFSGLPYIDVRVSFNSFVPADVDLDLSERLVNYYIDRLIDSPSHHDKVEFEIIFSCYTLDLPERLLVLDRHGFDESDRRQLSDSLRKLTNNIIHGESGLWRKDIEKLKELETRRLTVMHSSLDKISKIYWLIEDCKRYGTLPFAGLARAGFIAVQLLKSLVGVGILSHAEYDCFIGQLDTISSRMGKDLRELSRQAFLERYGHLRPGTYDILSPRYDEDPERYFDWSKQAEPAESNRAAFLLSLKQLNRTEGILKEHALDHDVLGLFDFIKGAIEGREYAKFVFTRSLSDVLSLIKDLGQEHGLSVEDCSYLDIDCVMQLYATSGSVPTVLRQCIASGMDSYRITQQISLPPLIIRPDDIYAFHLPSSEPNYVTMKSAQGKTAHVGKSDRSELTGSILLIPSADPGYDWIFSHGIAGFITMYGGVNSHMAIRAGELGIPAVIGAGEELYSCWAKASMLAIDCSNRQVTILR